MSVRAKSPLLSIAPMMDRTDRHYRYFMRQITARTLLYTEMVTTWAILNGRRDRILAFSEEEKPLALQLGGDGADALRQCARIAEDLGYDEVNINVGCPSDRVRSGRFGACLMAEPEKVADAVSAMRAEVGIPVTVKHRIGIDELPRYEDMLNFVDVVTAAGCDRFTVHARIAVLGGLSPKQNRTVPPLRYEDVYRLKRERPDLQIEINGGIRTTDQIATHLEHVDAVMLGRAAYEDPFLFADVDERFFGAPANDRTREDVVRAMLPYAADMTARGVRLHAIVRHMLGLFSGERGARAFKRYLSEHSTRDGAGASVLQAALQEAIAVRTARVA